MSRQHVYTASQNIFHVRAVVICIALWSAFLKCLWKLDYNYLSRWDFTGKPDPGVEEITNGLKRFVTEMLILIFLTISTDWWPGCWPTRWRSGRWSARTRRRGRRTNPSRSISLEQTLLRWDSRKSLVIQDLSKVCFNSKKENPPSPSLIVCLFLMKPWAAFPLPGPQAQNLAAPPFSEQSTFVFVSNTQNSHLTYLYT